jgi:hypothetical protein
MCKIILPLHSDQSHNCYAILTMRLTQFKLQCRHILCEFGICLLIGTHKVCLKAKILHNSFQCVRSENRPSYPLLYTYSYGKK